MNVQLDTSEVQAAITEYLRNRGVTVDDPRQIQLAIVNASGGRMDIVGCTPVVVAHDVKLPAGIYR